MKINGCPNERVRNRNECTTPKPHKLLARTENLARARRSPHIVTSRFVPTFFQHTHPHVAESEEPIERLVGQNDCFQTGLTSPAMYFACYNEPTACTNSELAVKTQRTRLPVAYRIISALHLKAVVFSNREMEYEKRHTHVECYSHVADMLSVISWF